jgi:hypothetical protein
MFYVVDITIGEKTSSARHYRPQKFPASFGAKGFFMFTATGTVDSSPFFLAGKLHLK